MMPVWLCWHVWGPWLPRGSGGYQKRVCRLCKDFQLRPTP